MTENGIRRDRAVCDHVDAPDRTPTCRHLAGPLERRVAYYRWLTGVGLEAELLCAECAARREAGDEVEIVSICEACREVLEDDLGDLRGFRGTPGVRVRLEPVDERLDEIRLPWSANEILGLAPIEAEPGSWLVALRDGSVCRLGPAGEIGDVCSIDLPPEEPATWRARPTPRLHASFDGAFAAIVNDYGRHGRVYDLRTGSCTIELDGGDYYEDTVPFSFAFVEHQGRTVAIHRTAWNRLDASDAATGRLLTERGPTSYSRGEERPEHYLDYFHGRLVVSPGGQWIVDDGWVWQPYGVPAVWDLGQWLGVNVWESEDGPSLMWLAYRDYWDREICWLDDDRIALFGIGDEEDGMIAGARVGKVSEAGPSGEPNRRARELGAFAGPSGRFFGAGERLFSAIDHALSIWDVESGALVALIDGFEPGWQHGSGRELLEISDRSLRRWRY